MRPREPVPDDFLNHLDRPCTKFTRDVGRRRERLLAEVGPTVDAGHGDAQRFGCLESHLATTG